MLLDLREPVQRIIGVVVDEIGRPVHLRGEFYAFARNVELLVVVGVPRFDQLVRV